MAYEQPEIIAPEIVDCLASINAKNYKKAIKAGKSAVKKYPKNPDAYYYLGLAYSEIGELKLALENFKKAENLTNNKEGLMGIYSIIGLILHRMGNLDDALLYYNKSLKLAENLGNTDQQAAMLSNIAHIYEEKGEFDKALNYYKNSFSLKTNEKSKAFIYRNIAFLCARIGDYQKAVEYFQKAIEIHEKYKNYHEVSKIKLTLGDIYRQMRDYKNAEKYLFEGLEDVKKIGDKFGEAMGYEYLRLFYEDKGDKKTAKEYFTRAYNLFKYELFKSIETESFLSLLASKKLQK